MKNSYKCNRTGSSLSLRGGLLVLCGISCLLPALLEARKFRGLEVHGDHRVLEPIVSQIPKNRSGVTTEEVQHRVMKKLMSSGIRPDRSPQPCHFLEVDLVILPKGTSFSVVVSLKKNGSGIRI